MFKLDDLSNDNVELTALLKSLITTIENKDNIITNLQNTIDNLQQTIADLTNKLNEIIDVNSGLSEVVSQLNIDKFGTSSETTKSLGVKEKKSKEDNEIKVNTNNKEPRQNKSVLDLVKEEVIENYIFNDTDTCPKCNGELSIFNNEDAISRILEFIPGKVIKKTITQQKAMCLECGNIILANEDNYKPLSDRGILSAALLSYIITQKYCYSMPIYRIEESFKNMGIPLTRQLMTSSVHTTVLSHLITIYNMMHATLVKQMYLHVDETTLQVISEADRTAKQTSYYWIYKTAKLCNNLITLYEYTPGRGSEYPKKFLKEFEGVVMVDGYKGYNALTVDGKVILALCWAHARRYFAKLLKNNKLDISTHTLAEQAVEMIAKLYEIEDKIKDWSAEQRKEYRLKHARGILGDIFVWLITHKDQVLPKSGIGKAIDYAINHWEELVQYIFDGNIEIDNNSAERGIKQVVIGRKNWLFSFSEDGAEVGAICYSIIETAKQNNLNPYEYINYLLEELPKRTTQNLDDLLPWSKTLPDYCINN